MNRKKIILSLATIITLLGCSNAKVGVQPTGSADKDPGIVLPEGVVGTPVQLLNSESESVTFTALNESDYRGISNLGGSDDYLTLTFAQRTAVEVELPSSSDLSNERSIKMQLSFPELICKSGEPYNSQKIKDALSIYEDTEQIELTIVDKDGRSHTEKYPFSNKPWLFDDRDVVPWNVNLREYSSRGVNLSSVESIEFTMASGKGVVEIHDFRLCDDDVMDLTMALQSETMNYAAGYNALSGGFNWGSCILKEAGTYHRYTAWWFSSDQWYEGYINHDSSSILMPATNYSAKKDVISNGYPSDDESVQKTFGYFTHNPEVIKGADGKFYIYYLSHKYGYNPDSNDQSGDIGREIGVAVADSPNGPWVFNETPIITVANHGVPCTELDGVALDSGIGNGGVNGIGNPRVVYKDGTYYLFYKILARRTDGCGAFYLFYNYATSTSPDSGFVIQNDLVGLKGYSRNQQLCNDGGDMKSGNRDIEDITMFEYRGKYYSVTKDFMGYWNRSSECDGLVVWQSDDLKNWEVADFPLVTDKVRTVKFLDGERGFSKMERPYLFLDSDGETGVMTFAIYHNLSIPFDFRKM